MYCTGRKCNDQNQIPVTLPEAIRGDKGRGEIDVYFTFFIRLHRRGDRVRVPLFAEGSTHLDKSAQEASAEPGARFFSQRGVRR